MQAIPKEIVKPSSSIWAGVFLGIGIMAGIDEIVFHQLLAWHHFYDLSTTEIGLLSDGLLYASELIALVAGFFLDSEDFSCMMELSFISGGDFSESILLVGLFYLRYQNKGNYRRDHIPLGDRLNIAK
ncbi:DUF2243 domain-containing protein [Lunatibacter salilacus]|uniref:DUF2243 domain-containing protein n=1 Tax=Lunatibacter salilacus TaxID=2483804 RepID=UPI00131B512C|nr:DUF2243 domain-containing protein [Lunatibacter salilacus]